MFRPTQAINKNCKKMLHVMLFKKVSNSRYTSQTENCYLFKSVLILNEFWERFNRKLVPYQLVQK